MNSLWWEEFREVDPIRFPNPPMPEGVSGWDWDDPMEPMPDCYKG